MAQRRFWQVNTIVVPFKFRCPFNEKKYDYYDGPIYFQPYGPVMTTETRILLTTNLKKKTYDVHEYQSQMNFFNRVLRPSYYQTNINHEYLDHCWDCVYFRKLIEQYVNKFNKKLSSINSIFIFTLI